MNICLLPLSWVLVCFFFLVLRIPSAACVRVYVYVCTCVRVYVCVCLVACWNRGRLRLRVPTYLSATGSIGFWSSWFFLSVAGVLKALFLLALKDISIDCH